VLIAAKKLPLHIYQKSIGIVICETLIYNVSRLLLKCIIII
jgi:hypothetical protein